MDNIENDSKELFLVLKNTIIEFFNNKFENIKEKDNEVGYIVLNATSSLILTFMKSIENNNKNNEEIRERISNSIYAMIEAFKILGDVEIKDAGKIQ